MAQTLEERVATLENEIAKLKSTASNSNRHADDVPWWEAIAGVFENDPHFEEAMRLGREYRLSQGPPDDEVER